MKLVVNNQRIEIEQAKAATIQFQIACGAFFREKRQLQRKTEDEVAEYLKITVEVIRAYESGKEAIPLDQVDALSKFLQIPHDEIMALHLQLEKKIMPQTQAEQQLIGARNAGKVVQQVRKTLFLSIKELASLLSKAGYPATESEIREIESGASLASAEFWMSFCSLCHLDLDSARRYSRSQHLANLCEAFKYDEIRIPVNSKLLNALEKYQAVIEANSYKLWYLFRFSLAFKRRWLR